MNGQQLLYQPEDKEEIFWIVVSFFAADDGTQKELLARFSLQEFPSDFDGNIPVEKLRTLTWCFKRYLPDFDDLDVEQRVWDVARELSALLDLMLSFSVLEKMTGLSPRFWNLQAMTEEDVWNLVRRLATAIISEWGMEKFPFHDLDGKIDLDYIGPEVV